MTYLPPKGPSDGKYVTLRGRLAGAIVVGAIVAGCEFGAAPDHPVLNRYEPGSRLSDRGDLVIWLGDECRGVRSVEFSLDREGVDTEETWTIRSEDRSGTTISSFTPGVVPDGFREVDPLRGDWRDADATNILLRTDAGQTAAYLVVSSFLEEAEERGSDEWFVQDQGWFTQDEYRADLVGADNADIYPMCTVHG